MKRSFSLILLLIFVPMQAFASVELVSLMPNPTGDDTLGEYIELRNTGCDSIDITGYTLSDLSGKSYTIPSGSMGKGESKIFPYSETRMALNNSGEEAVFLKNNEGTIIDEYRYSGTQKDGVVLQIDRVDAQCSSEENTSTGVILSDTGTLDGTGSTNSGSLDMGTSSGLTDTGSIDIPNISSTSTSSGVVGETEVTIESSGSTLTPEIVNTGSLGGSGEVSVPQDTSTGTTSTGETYIETGTLTPIELYYNDTDGNKRVDTFEIIYPYFLTGTVNTGAILLFSKTGGLSETKIDTLGGYILEGTTSGNTLILKIVEGELEKTVLKVNNSTSSDLRLKSSSDLGFRSIGGQVPEDFLLTKSLDEYRKVYSKIIDGTEGSGVITDLNSTGSIISSSTGNHSPPPTFPEIAPTIQSPTNASFSGGVFSCTTIECRVNITLEPMFASGYAMRDYACYFSTGSESILDTDCNPNTYYFSASGSIEIKLVSKGDPLYSVSKVFPFDWKVVRSSADISTIPGLELVDTGKPNAILEIDGKWKEYYEQIGDHEMNCHAHTCSINWTAEKSYDPEGSDIRFLWIYGPNDISTSKDPGTRKFPYGDHRVILRAVDAAGNYDEIIYTIHVLGPKPKITKEKTIKTSTKKTKISAEIIPAKKKIKKIRMAFFSPPEIVLQGKSGKKMSSGTYLCEYKRVRTCSFNVTLTGSTKGYEYHWILDGKDVYTGKNPKAWKLTPGTHTLELQSYIKGAITPISKEAITIVVSQAPKAPPKAKKPKAPKKSTMEIIPVAQAKNGESRPNESDIGYMVPFLFFAGIGTAFLIRRRKTTK